MSKAEDGRRAAHGDAAYGLGQLGVVRCFPREGSGEEQRTRPLEHKERFSPGMLERMQEMCRKRVF